MKPMVIVDANALHSPKAFSNPDAVLALAKTNLVRAVVPEVVVHGLSRQGAKEFNDKYSSLRNGVKGFNDTIGDVQRIGLLVSPAEAKGDGPSPMSRTAFFDVMIAFLHSHKVETPTYPDLPVADMVSRDLDYRKPFTDGGKGFRDALIWETIRELCNALTSLGTPVVFARKNYTDSARGKRSGCTANSVARSTCAGRPASLRLRNDGVLPT